MYTKNSNNLRIVSWGTPELTLMPSLMHPSKFTCCVLPVKMSLSHVNRVYTSYPIERKFKTCMQSHLYDTLLNAQVFIDSNNITTVSNRLFTFYAWS